MHQQSLLASREEPRRLRWHVMSPRLMTMGARRQRLMTKGCAANVRERDERSRIHSSLRAL